jgi:TRAP-type C4-dicarboxylate transport system substrate-binding protein
MQRGGVDAVAFPFTYAYVSYKIDELADWYTSNLSPGTSECPLVFNKTAYDALPPQYQDLLMGLKDEVSAATIAKYLAADEKNLPAFEAAMQKIVYDEATLEQFHDVAGKPVWDQWIADNADKFNSQDVFDQLWALAKEAQQ